MIFTKNHLDVENLQYLAPLGNSHHSVLKFEIIIEGSVVEVVDESLRFCHQKGDYVEAENIFKLVDWDNKLEIEESSHN